MGTELFSGATDEVFEGNIIMIKKTELARLSGRMGAFTLGNGEMENSTEKESM